MGLEVNNHVTGGIVPKNLSGTRTDIVLYNETDKSNMAHAMSSSMKHALKSKILSRRREQGLDEIPVDFTPRQSHPMTQEEEEKAERKRQSNRMSAKRSRDKQKSKWDTNEKILHQLESRNEQLLSSIKDHEAEKTAMKSDLKRHLNLSDQKINEILIEKVDYNSFIKNSKPVQSTSGYILKDIGASGDRKITSSGTREAFCAPNGASCDTDEAELSSLPYDLEVSDLSGLEDFQLSNDCLMNSDDRTNSVREVNDIDSFDMGVVTAVETVLYGSIVDNTF